LECHKVKDEQKHLAIDFITKFPRTMKQHDSIMVVVDKLIKALHFIPVKLTHKVANIAKIYMRGISMLHGVPKAIVSDKIPSSHKTFGRDYLKDLGQI
jgi:hypothetical protein